MGRVFFGVKREMDDEGKGNRGSKCTEVGGVRLRVWGRGNMETGHGIT